MSTIGNLLALRNQQNETLASALAKSENHRRELGEQCERLFSRGTRPQVFKTRVHGAVFKWRMHAPGANASERYDTWEESMAAALVWIAEHDAKEGVCS